MIQVKIYGCKNKGIKAQIQRASSFFIQKLMPRKRNLLIGIFLQPKLMAEENVYGTCYHYDLYDKDVEYTICLDSTQDLNTTLGTLAHELVHVRQFSRRELSMLNDQYCAKWKGQKYADDTEYEDMPWEVEANKLEHQLCSDYLNTLLK